MISSLTGKISHIGASSAQIVVSGGGFSFFATPGTLLSLRTGKETTVFTSLVVREDSLSLFGFVAEEEQRAFEILQSVRGIGPKMALGALGVMSVDELRTAVANQDEKMLTRIPGVGKKSAQRMILDIGDKLGPAPQQGLSRVSSAVGAEVVAALTQLGWDEATAQEAVSQVESQADDASSLLRLSLQTLGRRRG